MVEAYEKLIFENEQIVIEELPVEQKLITFTLKETNQENNTQLDKTQLLKKWKKSEGNYYLNPKKFEFSLKNLK